MISAKLTSKGQITLPKTIRDRLRLGTGDRVQFVTKPDGSIQLAPISIGIRSLKGALAPPSEPVSLDAMEAAIAAGATRHVRRK